MVVREDVEPTAVGEPWPTRDEVLEVWSGLLGGRLDRESVHEWTVPWIEFSPGIAPDPMVKSALYSLHGYDSAYNPGTPHLVHHGPPGVYIRTMEEIEQELDRWRAACGVRRATSSTKIRMRGGRLAEVEEKPTQSVDGRCHP